MYAERQVVNGAPRFVLGRVVATPPAQAEPEPEPAAVEPISAIQTTEEDTPEPVAQPDEAEAGEES